MCYFNTNIECKLDPKFLLSLYTDFRHWCHSTITNINWIFMNVDIFYSCIYHIHQEYKLSKLPNLSTTTWSIFNAILHTDNKSIALSLIPSFPFPSKVHHIANETSVGKLHPFFPTNLCSFLTYSIQLNTLDPLS